MKCAGEHLQKVEKHAVNLLKTHPKPHNMVREIIQFCDTNNIMLPSYRKLQDLYTNAYATEQSRLAEIFNKLPDIICGEIKKLINNEDGDLSLNKIRYDQADFSYGEIMKTVKQVNTLRSIYLYAKDFLPKTALSNNAIKYYANLVDQYPVSRLRKLNEQDQKLYVICYIYHRYQVLTDHVIINFMHYVELIRTEIKEHTDTQMANYMANIIKKYPKLAKFFRWFPQQESVTQSSDDFFKSAFNILPKRDFENLAKYFEGLDFDFNSEKWLCVEREFRTTSMYLRPTFLAVDFEHYKSNHQIFELMKILKNHYGNNKSPKQLKISDDLGLSIPTEMVNYLKSDPKDQTINPHRFEFYVYEKIYHHIKRGRMYCNDSLSHRDIDCDMVPDSMVDKVDEIAQQYGYPKLAIYCDQRLDDLLDELDQAWETLQTNIKEGENQGISISYDDDGNPSWQLQYDASVKNDDSFFTNLNKIDIADIFSYIDQETDLFSVFEHGKGKYVKRDKPLALNMIACILSEAFGFGVEKMSEMSDINFNTLRYTHEDFISIKNLEKANVHISNFVNSLPIFKAWNLLCDKLLADQDGQKESTKNSTIKSRYSKKYLGKGKGISILSLIANFVAVNVKNIGLNEYEGHHLFDMVYDNKSDIKIDAVTGDSHSINQINFVALDAIDVEFLPSMKKVKNETDDLVSTKDPSDYSGIIKPASKVEKERIKKHKRGITRVLISLITQNNTQATLIRKLNSHSRYAGLRRALYEYNKIFKSIHVLNMLNDMTVRKAMKTARNRTEAYHQLQKLIRNMYHGIFKRQRDVSHSISTETVSLVSNVIVAYNAIILNKLYEKMINANADPALIREFLKISPMAWSHIAFTGRYNFNGKPINLDLEAVVRALEVELQKLGIMPRKQAA